MMRRILFTGILAITAESGIVSGMSIQQLNDKYPHLDQYLDPTPRESSDFYCPEIFDLVSDAYTTMEILNRMVITGELTLSDFDKMLKQANHGVFSALVYVGRISIHLKSNIPLNKNLKRTLKKQTTLRYAAILNKNAAMLDRRELCPESMALLQAANISPTDPMVEQHFSQRSKGPTIYDLWR
jgi:hypothetical protein